MCDLTGPFDVSQPTISHHLKVLHEAGLMDRDQRGVWVYYRVRPQALASLGALIGCRRVADQAQRIERGVRAGCIAGVPSFTQYRNGLIAAGFTPPSPSPRPTRSPTACTRRSSARPGPTPCQPRVQGCASR